MSAEDNQKAIEDLQMKLAYIEDTLEKLSDEFYQQQTEVTKLQLINRKLVDKMKTLESHAEAGQGGAQVNEKPPHY